MKSALDAFLKKLSVLFCDFFPPRSEATDQEQVGPRCFFWWNYYDGVVMARLLGLYEEV